MSEKGPKRVAAGALSEDVSITLIGDDSGWVFHHWTLSTDSSPIALRPSDAHRAERFDSVERAIDFFRLQYGSLLRGSLPSKKTGNG